MAAVTAAIRLVNGRVHNGHSGDGNADPGSTTTLAVRIETDEAEVVQRLQLGGDPRPVTTVWFVLAKNDARELANAGPVLEFGVARGLNEHGIEYLALPAPEAGPQPIRVSDDVAVRAARLRILDPTVADPLLDGHRTDLCRLRHAR